MMKPTIKACVDRILPETLLIRAFKRAIEENPVNAPISGMRSGVGLQLLRPWLALSTSRLWEDGRTLRVRFLDGDWAVQERVEDVAQEWSLYANITFDFGNDPDAEIRITFREPGSWSFMGTDALLIDKTKATMNFGWLEPTCKDEEVAEVVLHEFGHALGCIHEHQHPENGIPWNKEAVYLDYGGPPNNWSRDQVDENIFEEYDRSKTQFSQFDNQSIMLYSIPNEHTIGDFEIGWNRKLSDADKTFMAAVYPRQVKPTLELIVGNPPIEAAIGNHGETDRFQLTVSRKDRYQLETSGPTDVMMALYGPNDESRLIADDDDSGRSWNARIEDELLPGTYYVHIRHHRPTGTGNYAVSIRTM